MKAQVKKLQNLIESLEKKLDAMDWAFEERSEKWQESDKGQDWLDQMNELENAIGELQMAKDTLETAFNMN
tara:strand:+ start:817 stop:1029 length:213 start_codon:yes stop_codon:yes gene_type:complete